MTARASYALLVLPPVVSGLALGFYMGTELVTPVITLFWLAVLSLIGTLAFVRRIPLWWALSAALSIALLIPATRSALTWTTWSFGGFSP
jgi:hypothetical protein